MADAAVAYEKEYTVDDIYDLPEGERAELIDGRWYAMATPSRVHQRISQQLSYEVESYIRKNGGDCQVYTAPFAVFLKDDNKNYLEPDISVICDKSKLDDKGCHGSPDIVMEVLSPSTKDRDLGVKLYLYRESGVREYWAINPDLGVSTVYFFSLENENAEIINQIPFDAEASSKVFEGFSVKLSELVE